MVMIFKNKKALDYLLTNGEVFTFRSHKRKKTGIDWINDGYRHPKIKDVVILSFGYIHPTDLGKYVLMSGFETLNEWQYAILELNGGKMKHGFLYRVTIIDYKSRS